MTRVFNGRPGRAVEVVGGVAGTGTGLARDLAVGTRELERVGGSSLVEDSSGTLSLPAA